MSISKILLNYLELMTEVRRLSSQKRTGTIFITSEDGHLVRFVLKSGRIIHLGFDTEYLGYDAIPLIPTIRLGRLKFAEGILEMSQKDNATALPNTDELLHTLETFYRTQKDTDLFKINITQISFVEAVNHLRKSLANKIGPFANFICDEYIESKGFPKSVSEMVTMIETVAKEIGDPKQEEAFKVQIKQEMLQSGMI